MEEQQQQQEKKQRRGTFSHSIKASTPGKMRFSRLAALCWSVWLAALLWPVKVKEYCFSNLLHGHPLSF